MRKEQCKGVSEMKKLMIDDVEKIFKGWAPKPQGPYHFYSVLVPLIEKNDELVLLFEVRSEDLKVQPGQICFPGGRIEEGETREECAVRETCEELKLEPDAIRVISPLDYLHTYSNYTMYPFLGVLNQEACDALRPNEDEVKEIFFVPLAWFLENPPVSFEMDVLPHVPEDFPYEKINSTSDYKWRKGVTTIPVYRYQDRSIWGLTALIIKDLTEKLLSL